MADKIGQVVMPFGTGYVIIQERHKPTPTKHIPYCGSVHFVGREEELSLLDRKLQDKNHGVALAGMGGVGKTELATQYARRYEDKYGGITWFPARKTDLAGEILTFFSLDFGLEIPQRDGQDRLLTLKQKVDWCWSQYPHADLPILVIFDDVSTLADLREVVPTDIRFRLLVTTRDRNLDPQFITSIPLDVLSPEKAVELLQNLLGEENRRVENEPEAAENICDLLGYLPLGITLVGGYLAQEPNLSLMDMLERLKQKKLTETSLQTRETINKEPLLGVQAAFELTWQKLFSKEEHELSSSFSNSQQLGMLLSLFAPQAIPLKLLDSVATKTETEEGKRELNWTPETVKEAQNQLWKYNLLQLTEEPESCCQLHSLVRWFLQDKLANSGELRFLLQRTFVNAMLDLADYLPDIPTTEQIKSVRDTMPHLEELAVQIITVIEKDNKNKGDKEEYSSQNLISEIQNQTLVSPEKIAWIFTRLGKFYAGYGLYSQAEDWYKRCLTTCQTLFTEDHPDIAGGLNSLATLYQCEGRYEEAEPIYQEALAMRRRLYKGDHSDVAESLNNLALFYHAQGRYGEAESLYQQALAMDQRLYRGDRPDIAISLNNLAGLYRVQRRDKEAESLHRKALEMRKRLYEGDHPDIVQSLNNLAYLYCNQERYREAEPLYKEALEMVQRLYQVDYPEVALSLSNLASLYQAQRRYGKAKSLHRKALEMRKRLYKGDHTEVALSLNNLAGLYQDQQCYRKAELLYKEALEMMQRLYGNDHFDIATSLNNLAVLYKYQGCYRKAESRYQEALEMRIRIYGSKNHPNVVLSLNNLAMLYQAQGRYKKADPLYNEALAICEKVLGKNHPNTNFIRAQLRVFQLLKFPPVRLIGMVLRIVFYPFVLLWQIWRWLVCCFYEIPEKN